MRVPDFELGNSPVALASGAPLGDELVLATTNGSPAVVAAAQRCDRVLIGSLLNLRALVAAIPAGAKVTVVCAGTDGRPALEDTYAAGRMVAALEGAPTDAARMAECVAERFGTALEPLASSENAAVLRSTGQWRDIAWCAHESVVDLVPEVSAVVDDAAVVSSPLAGAGTTGAKEHIEQLQR